MFLDQRVKVVLDESGVRNLLNGLYKGGIRNALKVIRGADGNFYIESRDLRIIFYVDSAGKPDRIVLHNERLLAELTQEDLRSFGVVPKCADVVQILRDRYAMSAHALTENLAGFVRTYGGD